MASNSITLLRVRLIPTTTPFEKEILAIFLCELHLLLNRINRKNDWLEHLINIEHQIKKKV